MNLEEPGKQIPVRIDDSLSALRHPPGANKEPHAEADKAALGIAPKELDTFGAGVDVNYKAALPEPTPGGTYAVLPDNREGFEPHRAYLFLVAASNKPVMDELSELLGEDAAKRLAKDWGERCDLNQSFGGGQVSLFLDSNMKARNRDYAEQGDNTTQAEDFKATGHGFADDLAATLLCARIFTSFTKLQDQSQLSDGERQLYQKLRRGLLRSCSGALVIRTYLGLRAIGSNRWGLNRWSLNDWALGSPLPPELEAA